MNKQKGYTPAVYLQMLQRFTETGECDDASLHERDAIATYLIQTMQDATVRAQVLGCTVCARVFTDTMVQFVSLMLQKANYQLQRASAELRQIEEAAAWSLTNRRGGWKALVQQVDAKYAGLGFERSFYQHEFDTLQHWSDDGTWQHFLDNWKQLLYQHLDEQNRKTLHERREMQDRLLRHNLQAVPAYLREHATSESTFMQTWALMGGRWNSLEFERLEKVTRLQRKYPVLNAIAERMGRVADATGRLRQRASEGHTEQMQHAAQCDIAGVSQGNDLGALLPHELAQWLDPVLEGIFLRKYLTSQLQTFDYQSRSLAAGRSLHPQPASVKGPMIVCVDRSGSMMGEPGQIALSLMMQLAELCQRQERPCYLIAFAVRAQPIDVMRDRTQLLRFFSTRPAGDTDARAMLQSTFSLLDNHPEHAASDVLWITDFRIPPVPNTLLRDMERRRQQGTRFFGLQIGIAENKWRGCFDEMFSITDVKMPIT
ncbi:MAG: hypothetical protein ACI3YD_04680 [Alloprevotella sp.]